MADTPVRQLGQNSGISWTERYRSVAKARFSLPQLAPFGLRNPTGIPTLNTIYYSRRLGSAVEAADLHEQGMSVTDAVLVADSALIVGDSGIGKSILLTILGLTAVDDGALPFLIDLAAAEGMLADSTTPQRRGLLHFALLQKLLQSEIDFSGLQVSIDEIDAALTEERCVVLLDGLNEIGDSALRNRLLAMVPIWRSRWPALRIYVSCTTEVYVNGRVLTAPGTEILKLSPFLDSEAADFLHNFVKATRPDLTDEACRALWEPVMPEVRSHPEIYGLPIYLTALAVAVVSGRQRFMATPMHDSYAVMSNIATWLIEQHTAQPGQLLTQNEIRDVMAFIGFYFLSGETRPKLAEGSERLTESVSRQFPEIANRVDLSALILSISNRGGLLRRTWADIAVPELIRDFFACEFLARSHSFEGKTFDWRVWVGASSNDIAYHAVLGWLPSAFLNVLGTKSVLEYFEVVAVATEHMSDSERIRLVSSLQRPLRDLRLNGLSSEAFDGSLFLLLLNEAMRFAQTSLTDSPLHDRVGAATTLALATKHDKTDGGLRFNHFDGTEPILIGAQPQDASAIGYDSDAVGWERTPHEIQLPPFGISISPVTCGIFQEFVDSGGYSEKRYWSPEGWRWLQSESFLGPLDWDYQRIEHTCPITGVSLYEANAFAAWLCARTPGRIFRLPSEQEWEYAARFHYQSRFAWGDSLGVGDRAEANWAGASIRRKTPVGLFAAADDELIDMVGNVEEWCSDIWSADQPEYRNVGVEGKYVVKGGSCIRYRRLCRPSYRSRVLPESRYHTLGFRVAYSLE